MDPHYRHPNRLQPVKMNGRGSVPDRGSEPTQIPPRYATATPSVAMSSRSQPIADAYGYMAGDVHSAMSNMGSRMQPGREQSAHSGSPHGFNPALGGPSSSGIRTAPTTPGNASGEPMGPQGYFEYPYTAQERARIGNQNPQNQSALHQPRTVSSQSTTPQEYPSQYEWYNWQAENHATGMAMGTVSQDRGSRMADPSTSAYISPALAPTVVLDPVEQLEREIEIDRQFLDTIEPMSEQEDAVARRRVKYKPKSSIPPDLSSSNYAAQCIAAAFSSRLPPFRLHPTEYTLLRPYLSYRRVTTYLNIRNGILRLWMANPTVNVTRVEAAGCVRDERYYGLAEFAFEWLVRNGYINHGCVEPSAADPAFRPVHGPTARRKPRQTVVVIGAGIAGLACARQLGALFQRYRHAFSTEYEDIPRIVVLEARRRIGGRVHTVKLSEETTDDDGSSSAWNKHGSSSIVDLGADTVQGFGGGNPLGTVLRRQLGLPVVSADFKDQLYNAADGSKIDADRGYRAHELFTHMLDRLALFESGMPEPLTARGDKSMIRAARDPPLGDETDELRTIAKMEELERPYEDPGASPPGAHESSSVETAVETKFLQEIGFQTTETEQPIHIAAIPPGEGASLGLSMEGFVKELQGITSLSQQDLEALNWYYSKFENLTGADMDKMSLNAFSHHRKNRFTGRHAWVRDGFSSLARGLATTPFKLDVRFKTPVTVVEYEEESAMCTLGNGEQISADRVVVTVPLGVLKRRSLQFIPDLPHWKTDSIERLEVGVVNKVVLLFDKVFWDDNPTWNVVDEATPLKRGECFMFDNLAIVTGKPLIVGLVSGPAASNLSKLDDAEVVDRTVEKLWRLFKVDKSAPGAPRLLESVVTKWQLDPLALGSHSFVGVDGTIVDHDLLGRQVLQSLFFAGEATSRLYPGTVHGAYLSGLRAARDVLNSLLGPIEIPDPLIAPLSTSNGQSAPQRGPSPMQGGNMRSTSVPVRTPNSTSGTPSAMGYGQPLYGGYMSNRHNMMVSGPRAPTRGPIDVSELSTELANLKHDRLAEENERMEHDLEKELGERPTKPDRGINTNPYLLFQRDYWDVCRKEADEQKKDDRKGGRATRHEFRAALGRRWKMLSESEKQPYITRVEKAREENKLKMEEFQRKIRRYESEADNFRQQWKLDHPSDPSDRELELMAIIDESHSSKKKRARIME